MMDYTYVIGKTNINLMLGDSHYTILVDSNEGKKLIQLISEGAKSSELLEVVDKKTEEHFSGVVLPDGIELTETTMLIDGIEIPDVLVEQFNRHFEAKIPVEHLISFIRKLRLNPSYRIRKQLWNFMEASEAAGGFTIAEDGDILAYKLVRNDFRDIYSGKFDNSPGQIVQMDRFNVDDDPENTCSTGLHFCAYSYLSSYGSVIDNKVVLVKVNPADIVSIPTDYGFSKARCCRYKVVKEVNNIISQPMVTNRELFGDDCVDEEYNPFVEEYRTDVYGRIEEFFVEASNRELAEIYRKLIGSDTPKKFENKAKARKAFWKNILDFDDPESLEGAIIDLETMLGDIRR